MATAKAWQQRLDVPGVDWAEVEELVIEAYRMTAPKRLLAVLDDADVARGTGGAGR